MSAAVAESSVIILAGATGTHILAREMVLAAKDGPVLVDATGGLEDLPEARLVRAGVGAYARERKET